MKATQAPFYRVAGICSFETKNGPCTSIKKFKTVCLIVQNKNSFQNQPHTLGRHENTKREIANEEQFYRRRKHPSCPAIQRSKDFMSASNPNP